ncbi:MAG TPA: nucleotidyltransferase family protein, partial [Phenylobacterium sp.]|nr:nucleotidyltransferase family protein [Phenylobacterium sp.]
MSLEARLEVILRETPSLMTVMETARGLDLPDWLIFSGAIYQRVLNRLTGRDPDYGIKDYDLGYHDASDISYEAEDVVI